MATTIIPAGGGDTITPILVTGYQTERESQTIVHPVLGAAAPDVTVRPAALRTGTLEALFDNEADAVTLEQVYATGSVFVVADDDLASVAMTAVPAGKITRTLDDETRRAWTVAVDFHEVLS